jgi:hypothetical protein
MVGHPIPPCEVTYGNLWNLLRRIHAHGAEVQALWNAAEVWQQLRLIPDTETILS